MPPGARRDPHIDDVLDATLPQQGHELLDRVRAVPDRIQDRHLEHATPCRQLSVSTDAPAPPTQRPDTNSTVTVWRGEKHLQVAPRPARAQREDLRSGRRNR